MERDADAFTEVFQQHYGEIERFVRRRAPDLDAADIVAEVFLIAWRRWPDMPRGRPLPWLYSVAHNVLANQVRGAQRSRRLREHIASQHSRVDVPDHANVVADRLAVADAFDRLNAADQEILRLVAWEGLASREIATVLGVTITTASMRVIRAKRRLQVQLRRASHGGNYVEPIAPAESAGKILPSAAISSEGVHQ